MILYRYIIREHILPFIYTLATIIFIFMMQLAVQLLGKILYKGLAIPTIIELFLINMAWMIVLAVPMAVLVTTLMTFGRMSSDIEIVAIKASGQNLFYLITPVFLASLLLTAGLFFFHNLILPDANHRSANLMSDISRKKPAALIEPNILIKDYKNYSIIVNEVENRTGKLRGIKIFSDIPGEDPATTVAEYGSIQLTKDEKYLQLTLYNGETHSTNRGNKNEYLLAKFDKHVIYIPNVDSRLQRTERQFRGDREKSVKMLLKDVASFKKRKKVFLNEYNRKIASFAYSGASFDTIANDSYCIKALKRDSVKIFEHLQQALQDSVDISVRNLRQHQQLVNKTLQQVKIQNRKISQYLVEVHKKYSTSFACVVFILIGTPLGIMAKRGGMTVGVSYSIFFFVMYWAFLIGGENLADRLIVPPALAMWSCNIIIGIFGIILTIKMVREFTFINYEPLFKLWRRLFHKKEIIKAIPQKGSMIRTFFHIPVDILNKIVGILPSYLIRSFVKNTIIVFVSLIVVFVVIDYISNLRRFETASFFDLVLYYWHYMAWFIGIILPIGFLLASMFSMGSLVKNNELTAIKASGMSVRRLTFPLLFLGICLSFFSFLFSEKILPHANYRRQQIKEDIKMGKHEKYRERINRARNMHRKFYYFGDKNTVYRFEEFRANPLETKNVKRERLYLNKIIEQIKAKGLIYHNNGSWSFVNGQRKSFANNKFTLTTFDTLKDNILTAEPEKMVARIKSVDEMSYWELKELLNNAIKRGEKISRYLSDLNFKIALPVMNFIVILLGLSVTARSGRRGGTVNFGIGLGLVFSYWVMCQFTLALGKNEKMDPFIAAWAGNIFFLIIGFILYQKASR